MAIGLNAFGMEPTAEILPLTTFCGEVGREILMPSRKLEVKTVMDGKIELMILSGENFKFFCRKQDSGLARSLIYSPLRTKISLNPHRKTSMKVLRKRQNSFIPHSGFKRMESGNTDFGLNPYRLSMPKDLVQWPFNQQPVTA